MLTGRFKAPPPVVCGTLGIPNYIAILGKRAFHVPAHEHGVVHLSHQNGGLVGEETFIRSLVKWNRFDGETQGASSECCCIHKFNARVTPFFTIRVCLHAIC
jgi:hypothetical protein